MRAFTAGVIIFSAHLSTSGHHLVDLCGLFAKGATQCTTKTFNWAMEALMRVPNTCEQMDSHRT